MKDALACQLRTKLNYRQPENHGIPNFCNDSRLICAILACMSGSSTGDQRAMNVLRELHAAEEELIGRGVVLSDGKAGTIDHVYLDDVHGLRISVSGHEGRWPISTVKHVES